MNNIYLFKRDKKESLDVGTDLKSTSALQELEIYWHRLKTGSTPPKRSQICATKIQNILPFIFLINYASQKEIFIRFIGASAQLYLEVLSINVRSKSLIRMDINPTFETCLSDLFLDPNPQKLDLNSDASGVWSKPLINMGLFPLLDECGKMAKAIGVIEPKCP